MNLLDEAKKPLSGWKYRRIRAEAIRSQLLELKQSFGEVIEEETKSEDKALSANALVLFYTLQNAITAANAFASLVESRETEASKILKMAPTQEVL